jgi:rhodanese-related sulfurtransferase
MKHLGKIVVLVAIGVALSLVTAMPVVAAEGKTSSELVAEAKAVITTITVEEAYEDYYQANAADVMFLDVREADEVEAGHIPGATWIARGLVEFKIASVFPESDAQTLVVYCKTGGRSSLATQTLQEMGYNVINMDGGFDAWSAAKYPVRRGAISASGGGCG